MRGAVVRRLAFFAAAAFAAGCGGGGSASSSSNEATPAVPPNVQPITVDLVDLGLEKRVNLAFTSVTICAPGSSSICQTIDHVQVDTGSSGLRILSSVLASSLALPKQTGAGGDPIVECFHFADGYSWGPVELADVKLAGEQASAIPIQVIGDPQFSTVPTNCSSAGAPKNTVQAFGANGILGVGLFQRDCGAFCASSSIGGYYVCPASGCRPSVVSLEQQVANPVALFATDNNGVLIQLPSVLGTAAETVSGSLIFGIGTRTNNALDSATILTTNAGTGNFTTIYKNRVISRSFIDAGSNAFVFADENIPLCASGFYCPTATVNLSATNQGANGATSIVNFSVANADLLLANNPTFAAFNNLGARSPFLATSFDWGLPFFYGRNVFTAIEGKSTPAGNGPYFAY